MKYYCNTCGTEFKFVEDVNLNCPICGDDDPFYDLLPLPAYETPAEYTKRTGKALSDEASVWIRGSSQWFGLNWGFAKDEDFSILIGGPEPPPDDWKEEIKV
jgi:hypothetical protein